jgi:hypothetical protein
MEPSNASTAGLRALDRLPPLFRRRLRPPCVALRRLPFSRAAGGSSDSSYGGFFIRGVAQRAERGRFTLRAERGRFTLRRGRFTLRRGWFTLRVRTGHWHVGVGITTGGHCVARGVRFIVFTGTNRHLGWIWSRRATCSNSLSLTVRTTVTKLPDGVACVRFTAALALRAAFLWANSSHSSRSWSSLFSVAIFPSSLPKTRLRRCQLVCAYSMVLTHSTT